jgi:hypothetical protein
MPITLKHINISDSDTIKLDKVNFNFDQLVANGGGPQGPQGQVGESGPQGTTGQQGVQGLIGTIGDQGPEGPISENYWYRILPGTIDADTILPKHTPSDQFAPVVNIGYIETNPQYGTKVPLIGGKTQYQWLIHRQPYSLSNLRFLNVDIPLNGFDFKLEKILGKDQLTLGFIDYNNSISTYKAASTVFKGSNISLDSLVVNDFAATFKTNAEFNSPVVIKEQLIIENADADTDKIVFSNDLTGLVKFKSIQELKGIVPFGTIVSISPYIFLDNDNFVNNEQIEPNDSVVNISIGKGIGAYKGWYLCHGKEWTNGTNEYQVPMLGKFNYTIEDDPFTTDPSSQGGVITSNSKTHITGGSDIDMNATSVSALVYNITSTVDTSIVNIDPGTGTTFKIKQLPQIIYLGENDLYWFDAGTGQAPSIPLTWVLDDENETASKLNPDPYTLGTINNQSEGASYLTTFNVEAPVGYYWSTTPSPGDINGLPGWATIASITLGSGVFPTTISITISVSSHPGVLSTQSLGIDTSSFISIASASMTLNRTGNPSNTSVTPSTSIPITYNFATGYTFNLVCTANSGYYFAPNPVATITSLSGGGTYTINSATYSNPLTIGHSTLTINVTITGVSVGTTSLLYGLTLPIFSIAPRITFNPSGYIIDGSSSLSVSRTITVENNTGGDVFIWAGINQFFTGTGISAAISGGYQSIVSPIFNLSVSASTVNQQYYSASSRLLGNGQSVVANLYRGATTDTHHTVQLWWSSTLGGIKQQINP